MKPSDLNNAERIALELGHAGRNAIAYIDEDRNADRPFTLHTYRPYGYTPDRPVVIVQHGRPRNGDEYRDFWIPAADRHKLLIVAPTFSNEIWPGAASYENGLAYTAMGNPRHVDGWAYALPGRVLADIRAAEISDCEQAYLFGHSAGGQFVHRLMSSQPHQPWRAVAAANSGWYTLPTMERQFPEGLGGVGLTEEHLLRLLDYPMAILAGEEDTNPAGEHLPSDPPARAQGPHRYARAHYYFEAGLAEANRRGVPLNWTLHSVPGVGHDGNAMSAACARLWFEGGL
jgi:hypothetical protein